MKILQVVSMGYVCGGAEKSVLALKYGLEKRGHQVKIMSSDRDPHEQHFSDYESRHIKGFFSHLWSKSAYSTLKRALDEFQPDVVHFHTMGELSPSVLFALGGRPALLTVHGPEEYTKTMLKWYLPSHAFNGTVSIKNLKFFGMLYYVFFRYLQRPLYKLGFKNLKVLVSPSKYLAAQLEKENFGRPIRQIYNGIELPESKKLGESPIILYVGRLEHVKGVDVLLQAMPEVLRAMPDALLKIVGDGPDRKMFEKKTRELGVSGAVKFEGWLKGAETMKAFGDARILVVPSVWPENLPTVIIEALAVGRPIIGSRVGGIPELVEDGVTGAIVEPKDAGQLAKSIVELMQDPGLADRSVAAQQSARRFGLSYFVENIERVYREIL